MSTSPNPAPKPRTAAVAPELQKTFGVTLTDANKNQLRVNANKLKTGQYNTFVQHILRGADGKVAETKRGASQTHADYNAARKAVDKLVESAETQGWVRRKGGFGGVVRKDEFTADALPKAAKAAKK